MLVRGIVNRDFVNPPSLVHGWNRAVEQCRKEEKETIFYGGISWSIKETPRRLSREFWSALSELDSANGRVIFPVHDAFKKFFAELCKLWTRSSDKLNWVRLEEQLDDTEINEWNFYFNCCNRFVGFEK